MRYWLFSLLTIILGGALCVLFFAPKDYVWIVCLLLVLALLMLLLLFRSVLMPAQTVRHGLDLISAQDFNNRLVKVGEPEADRIVRLFNTMIDKLRNERLLNMERESFLQLLVEASPMGVVMLDYDGNITLVNPSFLKMTGISSEEDTTGRKIGELPSELARRMAEVPLGESEEIRRGDIRRYRCYHLSFIQSGFKRRFFLLESLTEEVMKAERGAYEKVIRTISHEVNNTMGGVRSVLDTLHDLTDADDVKEVIESCDNRCDQMTRFISSYADVVRVPEPVKVATDINKMIADMMPFLQGMAPDRISLRFNQSTGVMESELDLSLMQQVIVNIVKNAVESISGNGTIEITASERDGRNMIEISNDGEPISEKVSDQLFSPFFTTKREGRGIGLTLISEILNRHGATYSLKTYSDGLTRFTIQF